MPRPALAVRIGIRAMTADEKVVPLDMGHYALMANIDAICRENKKLREDNAALLVALKNALDVWNLQTNYDGRDEPQWVADIRTVIANATGAA